MSMRVQMWSELARSPGVVLTDKPGALVPVRAPDEELVKAAERDRGEPLAKGQCDGNAVAVTRVARERGDQAEVVFGHWRPEGEWVTHAWAKINGVYLDPTAKLMGLMASDVEYRERIRCPIELCERWDKDGQSVLNALSEEAGDQWC